MTRSEGEEDLGGRRTPLSEGVPSPSKPPLTSPNFPQEHPPVQSEDLFRFVQGGCSWGKFLLVWEVGRCYGVRLRTRLIEGCVRQLSHTQVPRFRLLAPLRGSTERRRRCTAVNKLHSPTRVVPSRSSTNFLPFLSGSGESENVRISLAECGSEQPEFAARQTATSESAQTKKRIQNPLS